MMTSLDEGHLEVVAKVKVVPREGYQGSPRNQSFVWLNCRYHWVLFEQYNNINIIDNNNVKCK